MNQEELENAAIEMVERRGRAAMEQAKQEILKTTYDNGVIASALKYYAQVNLPLVMPIFPALMSIAFDTAKTNKIPKVDVNSVASAMVLIAFSADIHDDIIDQSDVKYAKKTVCGKFGPGIALLAGDALLIQGNTFLHNACESLTAEQRKKISSLIPEALYEISTAESLEIKLSKKPVINPDEHFEIMRLKGVVAEIQCRIGGILGQADDATLEALAGYGRTVGMLGAIKDEFSDVFNGPELVHRIKFECPPLPIVYAYQDRKLWSQIRELVNDPKFSSKHVRKIGKLIMGSEGYQKLIQEIETKISLELKNQTLHKENGVGEEATLLLRALYLK
jgi:geranylgeranyl pyrophosphate synthase